jgi:hypothetical protein
MASRPQRSVRKQNRINRETIASPEFYAPVQANCSSPFLAYHAAGIRASPALAAPFSIGGNPILIRIRISGESAFATV